MSDHPTCLYIVLYTVHRSPTKPSSVSTTELYQKIIRSIFESLENLKYLIIDSRFDVDGLLVKPKLKRRSEGRGTVSFAERFIEAEVERC